MYQVVSIPFRKAVTGLALVRGRRKDDVIFFAIVALLALFSLLQIAWVLLYRSPLWA